MSLTAFGGSKLKTLGQVSLVVNHRREKRRVTFEIVGNDQSMANIIGRQSSVMLGLVKRVHMMQCNNTFRRYADLFTGVGCLREEYDVTLDASVTPKIHPPRSVPIAIKKQVMDTLNRMEINGVTTKVYEPTDW